MSNRISGILSMTLIALCVIIVMEARSGVPSANNLKSTPDEDKGAAVAGPLRVTLPPMGALSETVERPLFSETRRPPEVELDEAPVSTTPVPMGSSANFVLYAIVITDDERAVLLTHPQSGQPARVAEGETIAGWRLDSVENDRAIFSRDGETREVDLRTFGPPPPRGPRRPRLTPLEGDSAERELRRTLTRERLRLLRPQEEPASER